MLGVASRNINLAPDASMQMSMKVDLNKTFAADSSGNITATLPSVAAGEHYIAVWTDIKNNIRESNISNNILVSDGFRLAASRQVEAAHASVRNKNEIK